MDLSTSGPVAQSLPNFLAVTDYPQAVGTIGVASWNNDGTPVENPVYPFKVRLHPAGEVEFPDAYPGMPFTEQLSTIPEGTTLYHMWGMTAPEELGGTEFYIGDLISTSITTTSAWGDAGLFFRHDSIE